MPRSNDPVGGNDAPIGPILAANFARLGYSETVTKTSEVARLVSENSGRKITRQRISNLLNAVRVNQETLDMIAKGLGVNPKELVKRIKP